MYLHLGQALKTGFQQNTEIEGCHSQLKEVREYLKLAILASNVDYAKYAKIIDTNKEQFFILDKSCN